MEIDQEVLKLFSSFDLDEDFNNEVKELYNQYPFFNCGNNRNKVAFFPIARNDEVGHFIIELLREIDDYYIVSDGSHYYMQNKCKNVQLTMRKFFIAYFQNAEKYLQGLNNE